MHDDIAIDARLAALLGEPDPPPDPAFVARVARAVEIDRVFRAARTQAWRRFRREALATGAVATAVLLLWRLTPAVAVESLAPGPVAAGLLALFLWQLVELRPAAAGR